MILLIIILLISYLKNRLYYNIMEEEYKPPVIIETDERIKLIMERRRIWDNKQIDKSENLVNVFFPSLSENKEIIEKSNPWSNFNKKTLN
jgi:hypothetical protein